MSDLAGKHVLVTGAARGIGAACAKLLAKAGAVLVLADIDEVAGADACQQIIDEGGDASFKSLDVSSETSWRSVIDSCIEQHGGLDVLVNNAGIALIKPIEETSLDEWRRLTQVNIDGVFLGMKTSLAAMKKRAMAREAGGSIINLSSAVGIVGVPGAVGYSMTKAAIRHMTKSAALEFAEFGYNIRVNSVHPGLTETPMADGIHKVWADTAAFGTHDLEQTRQTMLSLHPLGRYGQPEDIARGVKFLASGDSSYMTGAELVIDGGYIAR